MDGLDETRCYSERFQLIQTCREWEDVMRAIEACHVSQNPPVRCSMLAESDIQEAVHAMGCPRIATDIRIGTRTDKSSSNEHKRESVKAFLRKEA